MFNQKPTRTPVAVIAVALMLVLAGCGAGSNPEFETESKTGEITSVSVPMENESDERINPNYGPEEKQNLTEYSNEHGPDAAGLTASEKQRAKSLVVGFYDDLDEKATNESERRAIILDSADRLCERDQQFDGDLTVSMLEEGKDEAGDTIRRAHYAAQIANEFDDQVPVKPLENIHSETGDLTKYAPLLGSYNQMSEKACIASQERTDAAIQEYQIATVMFGVDAMLISTGAFYQPAFAGTRFTANKASQLGLYRLRYVCGDRCWALAMSEVHMALRGSMVTGTSNLLRQAGEMGATLSREDLEAVADQYNTDVDRMLEGVDSSTASKALESVSDSVGGCRDAVLESNDAGSSSDDSEGFFGGDGIDTGDVVDKGKEAMNSSAQAVEDCRDAGG